MGEYKFNAYELHEKKIRKQTLLSKKTRRVQCSLVRKDF